MEIESKTTQESERLETKLQQCEITTVYMGNVMLQNNQGMLEGQRLLESQATQSMRLTRRSRDRGKAC